jgi:hypothetical protein
MTTREQSPGGPSSSYDTIADVVGGVPNLRGKDNAFQGLFAAGGVLLGAAAGIIAVLVAVKDVAWWVGAAVGGVAGLILGVFISGLVLMIKGWLRAMK